MIKACLNGSKCIEIWNNLFGYPSDVCNYSVYVYFQSVVTSIEKVDVKDLHICDDCGKTYKTSRGLYRQQEQNHDDIHLLTSEV